MAGLLNLFSLIYKSDSNIKSNEEDETQNGVLSPHLRELGRLAGSVADRTDRKEWNSSTLQRRDLNKHIHEFNAKQLAAVGYDLMENILTVLYWTSFLWQMFILCVHIFIPCLRCA